MVLRSVVYKMSQECRLTYLQDQLLLSPFMHVSPLPSITYLWQGRGHWIRLWETVCVLSSLHSNCSWFENLWKSAQAFSVVALRRAHWGGDGRVVITLPWMHPPEPAAAPCIYARRNGVSADSWHSSSPALRQPGSRFRGQVHDINGTSRGGGSKVTRYQAPQFYPSWAINRQEDCCAACTHSLREWEHGTWKIKGIWPEPSTKSHQWVSVEGKGPGFN